MDNQQILDEILDEYGQTDMELVSVNADYSTYRGEVDGLQITVNGFAQDEEFQMLASGLDTLVEFSSMEYIAKVEVKDPDGEVVASYDINDDNVVPDTDDDVDEFDRQVELAMSDKRLY